MRLVPALLALSLLTCGCTLGQTRVSFGASVLADAALTEAALNSGQYQETNPVLKGLTITTMFGLGMLVDYFAQRMARDGHERDARWLYSLGAAVHLTAAAWNVYVIERPR